MNIYIQVVIYNKEMVNSATLSSLKKQKNTAIDNTTIILNIHDNSKNSCFDAEVISCLKKCYEVTYVHTPGNTTLRDIYNARIKELQHDDVLLLLDDDTDLPLNYIQVLQANIVEYKNVSLFSPKVMVNGKLYSPYKSYSFISRPLNCIKPGVVEPSNHAFINSGLAICGRFFIESGFRYPEKVDFYGTDTIFSHFFRKRESAYVLMDITIEHDVNNHPGNNNAENYANALSKVMRFWLSQLTGLKKIVYLLYMFLYVLKMTIKFRSFIFIKMYMGLK